MSKLRLWGHTKTINAQKVFWALDELGLEYERVDAGGPFGRVKDADYLTLNPNGLVPTLEDGPDALWESNAILRYLATKYGSAPFLPSDLAQRARADGWTEWASHTFWPRLVPAIVQLVRTPEEKRDPKIVSHALEQVKDSIAILERELSRKPFLAGNDFTFGDLPLAAAAQRWFNLPIERPASKSFEAWYARVKERPGFKRWVDLPLY